MKNDGLIDKSIYQDIANYVSSVGYLYRNNNYNSLNLILFYLFNYSLFVFNLLFFVILIVLV